MQLTRFGKIPQRCFSMALHLQEVRRPRSFMLQKVLRLGRNNQKARTFMTQVAAGGVSWGLGNYLSQTSTGKKFDVKACQLAMLYGMCLHTPLCFIWYQGALRGGLALLPRHLSPRTKILTAFAQMFLSQTLLSPFAISMYISYQECTQKKTDIDVFGEIRKSLPTFLAMSYTYWPFMDFLNFFIIPVQFRVFATLVQNTIWSAFVSYLNTRINQAADTSSFPRASTPRKLSRSRFSSPQTQRPSANFVWLSGH